LEAMLYEIGVEGVPMFRNAKPDHISMEEKYVNMELKSVREIDELTKAKSDAVMKQIKALNTSLDKIANCCDAKEAMVASPALEACASHSDVMALLNDLEAHMASIKITIDSSIPVTVCTSDVLRVLEKSCYVGGPSTPGEVLIEVTENQSGFVVSWNSSEVDEGKPEVSSYVVEVKIVREDETEDVLHKYTVMASTSSSSSPEPAASLAA
jgi:hypothetical protein